MENEQNKLVLLAENVMISEEAKLNPVFLTIDVKLCDDQLNSNREGVTGRFIADVVNRAGDFTCLPFYADKQNLLAQNYEALGHMYNRATRQFGTSMIGSMTEFYSDVDRDGVMSLYGKIKVPKRDRDVCLRLVDLYEMGHFAVSFEVSYDARELIIKDGGKYIDASENSSLTGLCLVWRPACESAYALDLVAERSDNAEIVAESEELTGERGETETMEKEILNADVQEEIVNEEVQGENVTVAEAENEEVKSEEAIAEEAAPEAEATEVAAAEDAEVDKETEDPKEEDVVAEDANAEVIEQSVDIHESVIECPETGETMHIVETTERLVETIAERDQTIAEQKERIAELEKIEEKYNAIIAEQEAKALAEKQAKAKIFAEKQGLNSADVAVAEAIEKLDYSKIAELAMAEAEDDQCDEPEVKITLASFVELEASSDEYGGLLKPAKK